MNASDGHPAVLDSVFAVADAQQKKSCYYVSDFYYKGFLHLKKRNLAVHFVPNRRYFEKGGRTLFSEVTGTMSHRFKTKFSHKIKYRFDAVPNTNTAQDYNTEFFAITPYEQFLLSDHLLSPLCRNNAHYYRYTVDSNTKNGCVTITYRAKRKNAQLVSGYFVYDTSKHYVTMLNFKGDIGIIRFEYTAKMGNDGEERYWPRHTELSYRYRYYGNIFDGNATFSQRYTSIDSQYTYPKGLKSKYDLSYTYSNDKDTTSLVIDSMEIARRRPMALTPEEKRIYEKTYLTFRKPQKAGEKRLKEKVSNSKIFEHAVGNIGEVFFRSHGFVLSNKSTLDISRVDLSYSGSTGVTVKSNMNYTHNSVNDRRFSLKPKVGYYFNPKQIVCEIRAEYEYIPVYNATFSIEIGSRDISNSTDRIESMNTGMPLQKTENAQSVLFNDRYLELQHSIEAFNGFDILVGTVYHQISPHRMNEAERKDIGLKRYYSSFAPRINLSYTPAMMYYYKGKRKIRVGSLYPTFSIDYERALRHFFQGDNRYEKWEVEVSQRVNLTPVRSLNWKIGAGMFTNKEDVNFVNYRYFSNGNMVFNWNDDHSGVFQLLDSKYYNDSKHYLRVHTSLESPTILLANLSTRYINFERVYINNLLTEGLAPYVELGYGLSTMYFDVSIFGSYIKRERFKSGIKFTLHL